MARKSGRATKTTMKSVPIPSTINHELPHTQTQKHFRIDNSSNSSTAGATEHVTQTSTRCGSSGANTTGGGVNGEVGDADSSEADEDDDGDDDEDGDGDVIAPPGRTTKDHGDQAGHLVTRGEQQRICKAGKGTSAGKIRNNNPLRQHIKTSKRNKLIPNEDHDSDDEAYNGVDDISDSDEDEPDMEKLEEKNIIESEEGERISRVVTTTSGRANETSDIWEGFDIDGGLFMSDVPYFDEQYGRTDQCIFDSDLELFQTTSVFNDVEPTQSLTQSPSPSPTTRRVHFREPVFPPSNRSNIVSNDEDLNGLFNPSKDLGMGPAELSYLRGKCDNDGYEDSSEGNSSGYETDYGDTTDEEDVPVSATTRPQSLLRQPSLSLLDVEASMPQVAPLAGSQSHPTPSPFKIPATPARQRPGPRLGSFKADPTKPFAMIDCTGDNIVITPAKRPPTAEGRLSQIVSTRASTANASPVMSQSTLTNALNDSDIDPSEFSSQVNADPMLASGSESMADILHPVGSTTTTQDRRVSGSSQSVFFPLDAMGDINALHPSDDHDYEDNDGEDLLNVEDFIDFGVDSSENEGDGLETTLPTPLSTSPTGRARNVRSGTPPLNKPSTNDLMAHFDKGVIGTFRRSQNQQQQQSHRLHNGLLLNNHAFKSGRHVLSNSPISSPKKRKMSGGFAPAGSFGPVTKRRLMHYR